MSTSPQGWQYSQYPQGPVTPTALVRSMRPTAMRRAISLMYAGAAAGAVSAIVDGLTAQHTTFYVYTSSSSSNVQHATALASGIISAIILGGLWLWMAWKTGAGRSWARVLSTVFFGIQCLGLLGAVVSLFGSGASVPGFILTLAEWGIGLAALILLWQPESSQFFASAQHLKRAAAYGAVPPGYPAPGYPAPGYPPPGYGQPQYWQPPQDGQPGYGEPPR